MSFTGREQISYQIRWLNKEELGPMQTGTKTQKTKTMFSASPGSYGFSLLCFFVFFLHISSILLQLTPFTQNIRRPTELIPWLLPWPSKTLLSTKAATSHTALFKFNLTKFNKIKIELICPFSHISTVQQPHFYHSRKFYRAVLFQFFFAHHMLSAVSMPLPSNFQFIWDILCKFLNLCQNQVSIPGPITFD